MDEQSDGAGDLSDEVEFLSGGGFEEGEGAQRGEEGLHGLRGGRGVNPFDRLRAGPFDRLRAGPFGEAKGEV